ncbi:MAG: hypothetical protein LUC91_00610 [Prevotella sp.]|nr:hypothetical protein [Prevotella sp.]
MGVNTKLLKIIVKESCRSLSYNDEERLFSFPLNPCLYDIWKNSLKDKVQRYCANFYLNDYNEILWRLKNAVNQYSMLPLNEVYDFDLLNGEILECVLRSPNNVFRFVKMERGQYLDVNSGKRFSLGRTFMFNEGGDIITSEGERLGICKSINLLQPSSLHVAIGSVFLRTYFNHRIADSLWNICDKAEEICQNRRACSCGDMLRLSSKLGVSSFPLLNILKAGCAHGQH